MLSVIIACCLIANAVALGLLYRRYRRLKRRLELLLEPKLTVEEIKIMAAGLFMHDVQ